MFFAACAEDGTSSGRDIILMRETPLSDGGAFYSYC